MANWGITNSNVALAFMAIAIVAASFAPVAPDLVAPFLKATAGSCTGLAALFLHPPGSPAPAPPQP